MIDLDQIKAGKYELVALSWDEPLSKPGEPYVFKRHERGDIVDLNDEEARRLYSCGAVVLPGERERAAAEALRLQYEAALAALPPEPKAKATAPPKEIAAFPLEATDPADQVAWVAAATIAQVKAEADKNPDLRALLLDAELARGDDARKTLVEALTPPPAA